MTSTHPLLAAMLSRRSVSPRRLGLPGPSAAQLNVMVDAALRAPDHGRILPWRLIDFGDAQRAALAQLFEDEKRRRTPDATAQDIERARAHATQTPTMLAFIVRPTPGAAVPVHEQWLAAGAALGQLVLAAHVSGFGAIVLSGQRCEDEPLRQALGIAPDETLAGFVSMGTVIAAPLAAPQIDRGRVLSDWTPD
ncbi:nitroreductase [Variovorax defluvii]|uniref:Putative NAD(P)H nitroreductase n=1 Tax=Variovorax defluvii TaxID=913761 RepID=A0ABP8H5R6_9BURK